VRVLALWLAAGLWFTACAPPFPSDATSCELSFIDTGTVRVFAVGHRFTLADADSYESYERSFRADAARIAPCLSKDRPNMLTFPEDSGLIAWFIGRRALLARGAGSAGDAFNGLYAGSYRQSDAYRARFPGISSANGLTLAASDTAWRAVERTFGGIAKRYGVWVVTSANLPVSERVEQGPDVARFRDPDAPVSDRGAYVAKGPEVFNAALLYGPDGTLQQRIDKVFLVDSEEQLLDMTNGRLDRLGVFELPFGRFGAGISRDAFYAPFLQRLEDLDVEVMVQPEAFSGWTIEQHPGDWLPDVILASGWSATQKYRGLRASVAPMLTGNLFDITFDGQVWVTEPARPSQPLRGFVGSGVTRGFTVLGPWAMADPLDANPGSSLEERRAALRAYGRALAPGSHRPEEGRYASSAVGADLALEGLTVKPASRPVTPVAGRSSTAIASTPTGHQFDVAAAVDPAGTLFAAWTDTRDGVPRIYAARSTDGGATWSTARAVSPAMTAQRHVALTTAGVGVVVLAWHEGAPGAERVVVSRSLDGLDTTSMAAPVDSRGGAQWTPALAATPDGAEVALAWVDFDDGRVARVRFARSVDRGLRFGASVRVDASTEALPRLNATQVQPSVAWAGRWIVAWLDYRKHDWQVFSASAAQGSDTFGAAVLASSPSDTEMLSCDPVLATDASGAVVLTWDDLRNRQGHHDVRATRWDAAQQTWQPLPLLAAGADDGQFVSRFFPAAAIVNGRLHLVFEDQSSGRNALAGVQVELSNPAQRLTPARVDDAGDAANRMKKPRLVVRPPDASPLVFFEDDRDGWSRIRLTRAP
jgi:predicted amidohydrolase